MSGLWKEGTLYCNSLLCYQSLELSHQRETTLPQGYIYSYMVFYIPILAAVNPSTVTRNMTTCILI